MKSVAIIKAEMKEIKFTTENTTDLKPRELSNLRKRYVMLKECLLYLETTPSETSIRDQIEATEDKISLRMSGFTLEDVNQPEKGLVAKLRRKYEKENNIQHLRLQVRSLRFLLK